MKGALAMGQHGEISGEALLELIKYRRSVRRYLPDPVPHEMVEQIVEAGRWAPSANNQQPWAFIVVTDQDQRTQVARHASYYLARHARVDEAPLLIVLCGQVRSRVYHKYLRGELGMAGIQMMLEATALGLGTCWVDGLDRDEIAEILQVPDYLEIVALITVGFPAETPAPTTRKPLSEIVHYQEYESLTFGAE
jgi:nitroreductase